MTISHPSRVSRRAMLQAGTMSLFSGAALARGESAGLTSVAGRAKNCILVYLLGGPPHQDMCDLKPQAPAEVRGPFTGIDSNVPGLTFCEHLPRLAQQADKLAVLRSLTYPNHDHPYMIYHTLTGRISPVPLGANTVLPPSRSDYPHMGAVVAKFKHTAPHIPAYVAIPEVQVRMAPALVSGGGRSGFLGPRFDPLAINDDPRQPLPGLDLPQGVSASRSQQRQQLLAILDGQTPKSLRTQEYLTSRETAFQVSRTTAGGSLTDLEAEPATVRDAYGRDRFGQSLLLARRMVERGVSFVGVHFNHMTKCDGWDTHKNNFGCLKDELLPTLDRGLAALLADLAQRGLLDETLVVTMGEFGRTPKVNRNGGRDHWGHCGSVLFAGGGVRGGNIVGASDKIGAYPTLRPTSPPDVVATIYHALGLDPQQLMHDAQGRPLPLSTGAAVRELF
ncbi:DUF1501 domain-containing protein [Symmachiella dynata]|uniref:DUF1501 domain-containing protein n=1 Tax=Symmachiella dynata TaxID=2527995 RepID=UPI0011A6248C|nr:DUF1501 domain-containing protein [Symmachiella dynata]